MCLKNVLLKIIVHDFDLIQMADSLMLCPWSRIRCIICELLYPHLRQHPYYVNEMYRNIQWFWVSPWYMQDGSRILSFIQHNILTYWHFMWFYRRFDITISSSCQSKLMLCGMSLFFIVSFNSTKLYVYVIHTYTSILCFVKSIKKTIIVSKRHIHALHNVRVQRMQCLQMYLNDHIKTVLMSCTMKKSWCHDDVIKWKHFPRNWPFVRGIHRSPVNSPHKGQWRGALMFLWSTPWINGWVNHREAGDLRHHRAYHNVILMYYESGRTKTTSTEYESRDYLVQQIIMRNWKQHILKQK